MIKVSLTQNISFMTLVPEAPNEDGETGKDNCRRPAKVVDVIHQIPSIEKFEDRPMSPDIWDGLSMVLESSKASTYQLNQSITAVIPLAIQKWVFGVVSLPPNLSPSASLNLFKLTTWYVRDVCGLNLVGPDDRKISQKIWVIY